VRRPARLVGRQAVPVSAGFPASPFPPGCFQPHRSGLAGFPASPFPVRPVSQPRRSSLAGFPASPLPVRPVSQLRRFQFGWSPASPVRAVRLPVRPGATRRPASARHPRQIPVSRPFPRPGEAPGWCPFLAVNAFLRPPPPSRKSRREFILSFFRIHMLSTESRRLSAHSSGYPLASAQLIHKSLDVTPRRGAKLTRVPTA
jgi:hypothetical protein